MMEIKCKHCNSINNAEAWNENTFKKYGGNLRDIEQGIDNLNYIYACPSCGEDCYKHERIIVSRPIISASGKPITDCSVIDFSK